MSENAQKKSSILVVDDDPRNRTLVRNYLQELYTIIEAENAAEAYAAVNKHNIDLVLLDVMLPGTSGFEICRQLKERDNQGYLPVLLLTALDQQDDRNKGLQQGADDYLVKPINRRELVLRVNCFVKLRQQDRLIREQVDALRHLDALKDDLVSLIVHDLRNPLAGLLGLLQVARSEIQDPQIKEDIIGAIGSANRLRDTIEDLLQVRLLEEGRIVPAMSPYSLEALIHEAINSVVGSAKERGIELRLITHGDVILTVDAKLLRRAVENLVSNAIKYSSRGDAVDLAVRMIETNDVVLEICDRGPGLTEPAKNSLFKKFGSLESRNNDARRGYGLGLYLVYLVMSAHHGRISVHDREGGGTVFRLYLSKQADE